MDSKTQGSIVPIVSVIAILVLAYFGYRYFIKTPQGDTTKVDTRYVSKNPIPITTLEEGKLPPGITLDMIPEKNVKIIKSFTADIGNGVTQSTIQYESKLSPQENFNAFKELLISRKFSLSFSEVSQDRLIINGNKIGQTIFINANISENTDAYIVDISIKNY